MAFSVQIAPTGSLGILDWPALNIARDGSANTNSPFDSYPWIVLLIPNRSVPLPVKGPATLVVFTLAFTGIVCP